MFRFPLWIEIDGVLRNCFLEGKKSLMYSELSCRKLFIISKQYKIEIISKDPPFFFLNIDNFKRVVMIIIGSFLPTKCNSYGKIFTKSIGYYKLCNSASFDGCVCMRSKFV